MNDRLAAMLTMAAMRDAIVVRLFVIVGIVLMSAALVRATAAPQRIRNVLIGIHSGLCLSAWVTLLVILAIVSRAG